MVFLGALRSHIQILQSLLEAHTDAPCAMLTSSIVDSRPKALSLAGNLLNLAMTSRMLLCEPNTTICKLF